MTGAVWTFGVLAAPFTLGGSLVAAGGMTLGAIGLGAKGGAVWGGAAGAGYCIKQELDE